MKVIIDSQQLNQPGENLKIVLQNVIDNTIDKYIIIPVEISFYVGYYNITSSLRNNVVTYSVGSSTKSIYLPDGLYTLQSYFNSIKQYIHNNGDNSSYINYTYNDYNGKVTIYVTSPYTFSPNMKLLGFNIIQTITSSATSDNPVNFCPHKMLYVHLKQIKNNDIYYNSNKSDILAKVPVTTDEFGTLVTYKFDLPYAIQLENTTINSLDLSITDENNNVIDFHGMPVFYVFEVCKL